MKLPEATYQRSPRMAFGALTMWTWQEEVMRAYAFDPHWEDHGEKRTFMLMGPDSPTELCLTVDKRWLRDETLQFAASEIVLWIDRCGKWLRGEYAPGLVPDGFRS